MTNEWKCLHTKSKHGKVSSWILAKSESQNWNDGGMDCGISKHPSMYLLYYHM